MLVATNISLGPLRQPHPNEEIKQAEEKKFWWFMWPTRVVRYHVVIVDKEKKPVIFPESD